MRYPNFKEERKLWRKGYKRILGLDEAGRGALIGPVTAAAVLVNAKCQVPNAKLKFKIQNLEVRDSKKLTPKRREEIYKILVNHPNIEWAVSSVSSKVIDKINILEATKLAMKRAIKKLKSKIQNPKSKINYLILDGKMSLNLNIAQKSIVKADEKVFSCAAASIIAKVTRDRIMKRLDKKYLQYGLGKHKGYSTKYHIKMLKKYGPLTIHRRTFAPVRRLAKINFIGYSKK